MDASWWERYFRRCVRACRRRVAQSRSVRGISGSALSPRIPIPLKPYRIPRKTRTGSALSAENTSVTERHGALLPDLIVYAGRGESPTL